MATRPHKGTRRTGRLELREPIGFKALSKAEQIRYLQRLWDRITEGPVQLPVPKSHLSLAKERLATYRRDPSRARPAHDVIRDLAKPPR
jgi:putative addiction module component (TIGR02574 family)